jgi:hypothetical protein
MRRTRRKNVPVRVRLVELGDQFPKFDRKSDVFTLAVGACAKRKGYKKCAVRWLEGPSVYGIPQTYRHMQINQTPPYDHWFLGDGDYKIVFL